MKTSLTIFICGSNKKGSKIKKARFDKKKFDFKRSIEPKLVKVVCRI